MSIKRYVQSLLLLAAFVSATSCAYVHQQDKAFGAESKKAVPYVRQYAMGHLADITEAEMQVIAETEPVIDHASYSRVNFHWPRVCTVVAGPPPCIPQCLFDDRPRRKQPAQ